MTSRLGVTFAALLCLVGSSAFADKPAPAKKPAPATKAPPPPAEATGSADGSAAPAAADDGPPPWMVIGPKLVDLGNNAEFELPAGMWFIDRPHAQELMKKEGNTEKLAGVVVKPSAEWSVVLEYEDVGFVDDDDADKLDANDLLQSYKEGTAQQNTIRRQNGVPELFVDGWAENPRYEKAKHQLVWGLSGHSSEGPVVNFTTRVLSRGGFLSVNLIASSDTIAAAKTDTAPLLQVMRFKQGWRYDDHKSDDKSSGMGLRALVIGGAGVALATKGGFLIKLLLIFKKAIIFVVVGIGGFFKWLFGRKKKDEGLVVHEPPAPPPSDPPPSV